MSHAQWLKLTYAGLTSIRSAELRKVDAALADYHRAKSPAGLDVLQSALVGYLQKEGAHWKSSPRNKYGAIDTLYHQVMGLPARTKTASDIIALSHLREESRAIVTELFRGKSLEWRPGIFEKLGVKKTKAIKYLVSVEDDVNTVSNGAVRDGVAKGAPATAASDAVQKADSASKAEQLCQTLIPPEYFKEVMAALVRQLPTFMSDLAVSVTPFVGVLSSGGGTAWKLFKSLREEKRVHDARIHHERNMCINEPYQAMAGLIRILERDRDHQWERTAISVAEFTGKLIGTLADGGTATNAAIGLAGSLAELTQWILEVVRDVKERRAANKLMASPRGVDASIFVVCPIVGAYLVCCAPTSVLVNTVFDRFFEHGWKGDVEETVKRHIAPLQQQARRAIKHHRFWIPSLQNFPNMLGVNKKKLEEMAKKKGKTGMVGFGSDSMPS